MLGAPIPGVLARGELSHDPRLNGFEAVRYVGSTMFPLEFRLQNQVKR